MLGILGVTAVVLPLQPGGITGATLGVMVGSAVVVAGMAVTGRRITRVEGAVLVAGYLAYTIWLVGGG